MRITQITAIPYGLPYRRKPRFASGAIDRAENVLVRVHAARPLAAIAALGLLAGMTARALAVRFEPTDSPSLAGNRVALLIGAVGTVTALAVASWPAMRTLRARRAVAQIVRRLGDLRETGAIEKALAAATGNPRLRIVYRGPSGWIDPWGNTVEPPSPGVTAVRMNGEAIAAISGLDDDRQIGPTLRLGIANEQLRAGVLARLADLHASRERVVEAGDAERRQLERNLHDGAQQRLLALSFELRRARSRADDHEAVGLDHAITETDLALAELRDLAHGIFPAILAEAGLETALRSLADRASVPVDVRCSLPRRPPPAMEMAVYRLATEAVDRAATSGRSSNVEVTVDCTDDLVVRVTYDSDGHADDSDDGIGDSGDRVAALKGAITVLDRHPAGSEIVAVIPCES